MTSRARAALITAHLPLVSPLATRAAWRWRRIGLDELDAAGQFGLVDAAQRFDPTQTRANFAAFARRRIWGAILDHVRAGGLVGGAYRPGRQFQAAYTSIDRLDPYGQPLDLPDLTTPTPETQCADRDEVATRRALLRRGLASLSPTDRQVLVDRYVRDESLATMGRRRHRSTAWMSLTHAALLAQIRRVCGVPVPVVDRGSCRNGHRWTATSMRWNVTAERRVCRICERVAATARASAADGPRARSRALRRATAPSPGAAPARSAATPRRRPPAE